MYTYLDIDLLTSIRGVPEKPTCETLCVRYNLGKSSNCGSVTTYATLEGFVGFEACCMLTGRHPFVDQTHVRYVRSRRRCSVEIRDLVSLRS